jgi:DNA-binding IclR family transcriptional regulator
MDGSTTSGRRESARRIASVERALAVLDVLAGPAAELGTNEIARRTGVNASTVSRLLATLTNAGYVEQVPATGRYRLGVRLVRLGHAVVARLDLRELGRPQLEALVMDTGETATLSLPAGLEAVTVDFAQSPSSVQSVAQLGRPSVGHATATGKVMLAYGGLPLPPAPLQRYTPHTITELHELEHELALTRERGWGRAVGEREPDLNALAAPVTDARGELAAVLGVQGPAARFDGAELDRAVPPLVAAAAEVSRALGADRDSG